MNEHKAGLICSFGCAAVWGFLPIYWNSLSPINSFAIIFYRIILVGIITFIMSLKMYGGINGIVKPLKEKGLVLRVICAGIFVTGNWSLFIWAVNAGYVIQTSIGYFIQPLVVCVFGVVLFHEKLTKFKIIALILAALGVLLLLIYFGEMPKIALGLAVSFSIYAAIKKTYKLPAFLSLFYETIFLSPVAVGAIIYFEMTGHGALATGQPYQLALLSLSGFATIAPLSLFGMAANRLTLVEMGITQYLAPSISLLIGIFYFKEAFDLIQFISFVIIWIGMAAFTWGEFLEMKKLENT